ncbi:sodium/calcium exchanger NCL-like isoform X1 [Tripterygium wilfordii]|uniref:sodium/calcium exchanger NCL-like isoform X1 n=1 Tax=Tripterygium wilfordii TaxID=458696 RepID=UPI0018F7FF1C|nr:sodium/calcium exchanger NCL-like isoform X1 [Tripterygium wilfordii]
MQNLVMAKKHVLVSVFIFLIVTTCPGQSRIIRNDTFSSLVSDGANNLEKQTFIGYKYLISMDSCSQTYGFLPCTSTVLGNIFLIVVYGYLMFLGAKLLSNGSEILLQILGPGIIGGLVLPVLSSVPDATIILASGLSGIKEDAQNQVSVGIGLLAGSTVMLLTVLWGSCLIVGKCDLDGSVAMDLQDTRPFSLTGSGVSTDIWTSYAARIMVISIIPFLLVQLSQFLGTKSQRRIGIMISLIVSITLVLAYSLYQVLQPWIQKRKIAYAKHKQVVSGVLKELKMHSLGKILMDNGEPDVDVIKKLFRALDRNSDGNLSTAELRALIVGIQFDETVMDIDNTVEELLKEFDKSRNSLVDEDEFVYGISGWLNEAKRSTLHGHDSNHRTQTKKQQGLLGDRSDEDVGTFGDRKTNITKAVLMLLLGTTVAAVFADPLVDAVDNFSTASSIPSFFVSFVILPFASSSEVVSTMIFASRKKLRTASLTYSEIYGSVTMSNILSLSVFLGLVYFRELDWNFSSEVVTILIVCIVMGMIASFRTTFPLWMCFLAFPIYPFSLLLVYVLNNVLGLP